MKQARTRNESFNPFSALLLKLFIKETLLNHIFFKALVGIYFYSQLFKNLSYDPPLTFPY